MNKIIPKFNESLIMESSNILIDYMELGIDSALENDYYKEIPIVKTMVSLGKITKNIREKNTIKNLVIFINELNSGSINEKKLKKHKKMLEKNPKKAEKELGRILVLLEQLIDNEKVSFISKLYKAYVNQMIDWEMFIELCDITNRIFIKDVKLLKVIWSNDKRNYKEQIADNFRVERLYSLGIIGNLFPTSIEKNALNGRTLNQLGNIYCNIIFKE